MLFVVYYTTYTYCIVKYMIDLLKSIMLTLIL